MGERSLVNKKINTNEKAMAFSGAKNKIGGILIHAGELIIFNKKINNILVI
jgi:hypothetical protein